MEKDIKSDNSNLKSSNSDNFQNINNTALNNSPLRLDKKLYFLQMFGFYSIISLIFVCLIFLFPHENNIKSNKVDNKSNATNSSITITPTISSTPKITEDVNSTQSLNIFQPPTSVPTYISQSLPTPNISTTITPKPQLIRAKLNGGMNFLYPKTWQLTTNITNTNVSLKSPLKDFPLTVIVNVIPSKGYDLDYYTQKFKADYFSNNNCGYLNTYNEQFGIQKLSLLDCLAGYPNKNVELRLVINGDYLYTFDFRGDEISLGKNRSDLNDIVTSFYFDNPDPVSQIMPMPICGLFDKTGTAINITNDSLTLKLDEKYNNEILKVYIGRYIGPDMPSSIYAKNVSIGDHVHVYSENLISCQPYVVKI